MLAILNQNISYVNAADRVVIVHKGAIVFEDIENGIALVNGDHVSVEPDEYVPVTSFN
ncbi:MAG: hypothetical protein AB7G93_23540 [Bdellovibrionales bacterium]